MSKSLTGIHKDVEREKITRDVMKRTEEKIIPYVMSGTLAAVAIVLHDKYGFGTKRLNDVNRLVFDTFESVNRKYLTLEDIYKAMKDELGIDFEKLEREIFVERKKPDTKQS